MATIWACHPHLKKYGHDDGMADGTAQWDQSCMTASFKNFRTTENPCWVRELVEPFPTPPPFVNCFLYLRLSMFFVYICLHLSRFVYVSLSLTNTLLQVR